MKKEIFYHLTELEQRRLRTIVNIFAPDGSLSIRHLEAIKELIDEAIEVRYKQKPK